MTDILKQFEQTSNKAFNEIDDEALGQLGSELDRMRSVQEQIKLTELKVKNLKDEEQTLADSITDLLQSKGLSELKLTDGSTVTTKEKLYCSITEENKEAAHNWVRNQGDGDIIANVVSVDFKKGEDDQALEFKQQIENLGLIPNESSKIHGSTLRSYLVSKDAQGVDYDDKLFSVRRLNKVTIKQS
jgi:hypothetical protein|tara:strand:- start:834 stop:1394 length:561 start_codon:yes stop_codon:yes gene_type:complete